MEKLRKFIPLGVLLMPIVAWAVDFQSILQTIGEIVGLVVPLLIGIALVVFIWGIIKYITAGGDEAKRTEARNTILYGIIGLFAIVAVWGLVRVLSETTGIDIGGDIEPPTPPSL